MHVASLLAGITPETRLIASGLTSQLAQTTASYTETWFLTK